MPNERAARRSLRSAPVGAAAETVDRRSSSVEPHSRSRAGQAAASLVDGRLPGRGVRSLTPRPVAPLLDAFEQRRRRDVEATRQADDRRQARLALAAFEQRDLGTVQLRRER